MSDVKTDTGGAADGTVDLNHSHNDALYLRIRNKDRADTLDELKSSLELNTDKKATSYFSWVKHISTMAAGALAVIATMYKGLFVNSILCFLCLMAAMVFFALTIYLALLSLIEEPAFYAAKCENVRQAISNCKKNRKSDRLTTLSNYTDWHYEKFARDALFYFVMGLSALVLYVFFVYLFGPWQKHASNIFVKEIIVLVLGVLFFGYWGHLVSRKTKKVCIKLNLQNECDYKDVSNKFQDEQQKNQP